MQEETITIDFKYYQELVEAQQFLLFLKGAGVDNWDGYSDVVEYRQEEISKN
jgi:hypothetical protein